MKITKVHWLGIIFAVIIVAFDLIFFFGERLFYFLLGIALVIVALPFLVGMMIENRREREKNERFLEFTRNLAEGVKTGTPIGQSIMNMRDKNYGSLSAHVGKLANQISMGIPISKAFSTFASEIGSDTVRRAVGLIREAENAGGKIDNILDSVADSIYEIEKLKKERRAAISNLVVQGYIIFFIFIGIMLVMQFKVLPLTAGVSSLGGISTGSLGAAVAEPVGEETTVSIETFSRPFLYLLLIQGIFAGLTIGKLAEGSVKSGIKHSFVLSVTAFLISTGAKVFLG